MKKTTSLFLLGLFFLPSIVSAAWWNPFTWGKVSPSSNADDSTALGTTTIDTSLLPTVEDLNKRIAELELKLDDARERLKQAGIGTKAEVKSVATTASPVATTGGISEKDLMSKVRPAIVLVETASSSAAASIIDVQGHIFVSAHAVWIKDVRGDVVGAFPEATVTLSSGAKKKAVLVGIDELSDIAILQLSDKNSSAFIPLNYDSGIAVGDKAYIVSFPSAQASGGSTFVGGTIAQKTSSLVQVTADSKPLDNGGAMITGKGALIGIPNPSSCKVLEEMKNCLKYTVTSNLLRARIPKVIAGMKLYRDKKNETADEILMRGYIEGAYNNVNQSDAVEHAVSNATGKNSFDYLNSKLINDTEDKMAKVYLLKLKSTADGIYLAFDFLKSISYALRTALINDAAAITRLDSYQQKIMQGIQADNDARLKDYQSKIEIWSKKKNEYDSYLTRVSDATNDYLMAEGVSVESAAEYLGKERQKIIDGLSGENLDIF